MGTGTDVAMESAGVTLVQGDLRGLVRARRLSRATMRNIRQNLFFAFIDDVLGVPVAVGVLYPAFGAFEPRSCKCGDDVQLGFGDRQRGSAAHGQRVSGAPALPAPHRVRVIVNAEGGTVPRMTE